MNAADYYDWYHFSGTGLGTTFPGETLKQLHQELSRPGANVVIVSRFLDECRDIIDVGHWRRALVFGQPGLQVQLTAEALEAIGARAAAAAVQEERGFRPVLPSEIPGRAGPGRDAGEVGISPQERFERLFPQMGSGASVAEMMSALQEKVRARHPELGASSPLAALARVPQPQQTEGVEPRPEIIRLLDVYVAAHQEELGHDVARYGDPRQAPGFDRERAADERARQSNRILQLRAQAGEAPALTEKLAKLRQKLEKHAPDSVPVQRERQRIMEEFRRYAKRQPDELSAEVKAWLREVRALREKLPEVFRPRATKSEQLNARLEAIGKHSVRIDEYGRSITWPNPSGLACGWSPPFSVGFHVSTEEKEPNPARIDQAYEKLLGAWERFRERFPKLEPELRQYLLDFFRQYRADDLPEDERAEYEDQAGQLSDDKILAHTEGATAALTYHAHGEVETVVHFDVPWDEEHGLEVQFGPDGKIEQCF
jgi:hypothetical protein